MNTIIIDDEPLARQRLERQLLAAPFVSILGSFATAQNANELLVTRNIDLLLMDINMPDINGLQFIESLEEHPMVIFITAYPQYALDSYELDAIDYLVKPVRQDRLLKALNKARQYTDLLHRSINSNAIESIETDYIFVKADRRYIKLYFSEIRLIEGLKDYVVIYAGDQKIITGMNIKAIFSKLPSQLFARISKSYIVNIGHILSFDNYSVYLRDEEIPIGETFKEFFFKDFVQNKIIKRGS